MIAKRSLSDFAIFGGRPAFGHTLPVGQLYFPSWERYEAAMRGIFATRVLHQLGPPRR